jgi:ABC-type Fe3+-hydroxamate transport system substrate-binding protein
VRVVSLCPSLTESVFRLGRGATLVGRTKFCVQPRGAIEAVERVGGTKNPQLEKIVALRPDLVLMNEEENRKEDADALADAGVPVLSTFARDVAGAKEEVLRIGDALATTEAARALCAEIDARAEAVHACVRGRPPVSFIYLIWREPLMAVGPDTYVDALLRHAGGRNVVTGDRYPTVVTEQLAQADRILCASEPFPFAQKHIAELMAKTGLVAERFQLVDGELLSWHGARTVAGLDYAASVLGTR